MKNAKSTESTRYENTRPTTREHMHAITDYISAEYGEIPAEWVPQLDALALNYELLSQASETVQNEGLMVKNRFGGAERHPLLKVIFDAQVHIQKITNQLGLSPSARGKIKRDASDSDAAVLRELLD